MGRNVTILRVGSAGCVNTANVSVASAVTPSGNILLSF